MIVVNYTTIHLVRFAITRLNITTLITFGRRGYKISYLQQNTEGMYKNVIMFLN